MKSVINGLMKVTLTALLPWTVLCANDTDKSLGKNEELNEREIRLIIKSHKFQ